MISLANAVLEEVRAGFSAIKAQADSAVSQLPDDDLFRTLDAESNSVAVIMRHCAGNMRSRWKDFLTTDGEKPDRERDAEFEAPPVQSRATLLAEWEEAWGLAITTIHSLDPDDLLKDVAINGEQLTVLAALGRATRHYAGHSGQIVLLAKHLRGPDWKTLTIPRGQSHEFFSRTRRPAR